MNMTRRTLAFVFLTLMALALSLTPLISAQETETPSPDPTLTATPTATLTMSPTAFPTGTATATITSTSTLPATLTPTTSEVVSSPTLSPTASEATSSATLTASPTIDATLAETPTSTATLDNTPSATVDSTPTASLTATPSATGSATGTLTSTPTASPTDTAMTLIYADNFDSGDLSNWAVGAGWSLVPSEGGQAMQVSVYSTPLIYNQHIPLNGALHADIILNNGSINLKVRGRGAEGYIASLNANGQITLFRNSVLMATALTTPWLSNQGRNVRFSIVNSTLSLIIDDVEILTMTDGVALSSGSISIYGDATTISVIDNVEIWYDLINLGSEATPTYIPTNTPVAPEIALMRNAVEPQSSTFTQMQAGDVVYRYAATTDELRDYVQEASVNWNQRYVIWLTSLEYVNAAFAPNGGNIVIAKDPSLQFRPILRRDLSTPGRLAWIQNLSTSGPFPSTVVLRDVIVQNYSSETSSGGVFHITSGNLYVYNVSFQDNYAGFGGGVTAGGGNVHIWNSAFENNFSETNGGALAFQANSSNSIVCSTFKDNSAQIRGGAIFNDTNSTASLINVNFHNNTFVDQFVGSGGSIYNANNTMQIQVNNGWWGPSLGTGSGNAPLSGNNSIAGNIVIPTPAPSIIDITNPTNCPEPAEVMIPAETVSSSTATPTPMAQTTEQILAGYGITISPDGIPDAWAQSHPDISGLEQAWTQTELDQMLAGVQKTAEAFYRLRHTGQSGTIEQHRILFRSVMGDFTILRVQNGFDVDSTNQNSCDGAQSISCTDNFSGFIAFYGALPNGVTEYVLVHELGHRFNARSDGSGRSESSLYGRMQSARVFDYSPNSEQGSVLFGATQSLNLSPSEREVASANGLEISEYNTVDEWVRRDRGWGTGPASIYEANGTIRTVNQIPLYCITNFQQNSQTVESYTQSMVSELRVKEIDEATADMFLNWVYRTIDSSSGFQNINWSGNCNTVGQPDNLGRPGDRRNDWMNTELTEIFDDNSQSGW